MGRNDFEVMMEFFRARLREDENAALTVKPGKDEGIARLQARILADVAVKRDLMAWVEGDELKAKVMEGVEALTIWKSVLLDSVVSVPLFFRRPVIYNLVAAYADHPDFRSEWLPDEYQPGAHESSTRRGPTV